MKQTLCLRIKFKINKKKKKKKGREYLIAWTPGITATSVIVARGLVNDFVRSQCGTHFLALLT